MQTTSHSDWYRGELLVNYSTGALWLTITNLAVLPNGSNPDIVTNSVGRAFVPRAPQPFAYDLDGNLTNDGRFAISWDAENRATSFTSLTSTPAASRVKVDCTYDSQWRRTQKIVSTWSGTNYNSQFTNHYIYDGWNLIAVLDHTNGILYSFTWGTDISGTEQGAGGVGGLISMRIYSGTLAGTYFYVFDGNGNVMALVNASNGAVAAQYEYSPFGETLRATGPLASINPFRFSTKFQDEETGLVYYGYRYYNPSSGSWLSRDSIGETGFILSATAFQPYSATWSDDDIEQINRLANASGGLNLYGFCANSPLDKTDRAGLDFNWGTPGPIPPPEKGAYGPFYNPEPGWFMHPADEGKPCCCQGGPAKINVKRTDDYGSGHSAAQIVMEIDLKITGCYKDLFVIWDTCWRSDDAPGGPESSGALWKDLNSTSSLFEAYGTMYRTKAHLRLLSCESGKWKVRGAKAGRGYIRSVAFFGTWSIGESTGYY